MTDRRFLVLVRGLSGDSTWVQMREYERRNPPPLDTEDWSAGEVERLLAEQ